MEELIGIIAAMQEEMQEIKFKMIDIIEEKYNNITFYKGSISNKKCILVKCGVGKVNSARVTQLLIDKYNVSQIINIGSAGAIKDNIEYGDIIIGKELVQHDFDITAFGHEKGYITDIGKTFYSEEKLIKKAYNVMKNICDKKYNVHIGNIASGDIFITNMQTSKSLVKEFNSDCVEMEGAAIAQVCYLENIPFICIRSISDTPNGNNNIEFDKYIHMASKRCAEFITEFLK